MIDVGASNTLHLLHGTAVSMVAKKPQFGYIEYRCLRLLYRKAFPNLDILNLGVHAYYKGNIVFHILTAEYPGLDYDESSPQFC